MIENMLKVLSGEPIDYDTSNCGKGEPKSCYCKEGRDCLGQPISNFWCMRICPVKSNSEEEVDCDPTCEYCQVLPSGYTCLKLHKRTCFDSSVEDKDFINGVVNLPEIPKCLL
jgi:hypothetical protein